MKLSCGTVTVHAVLMCTACYSPTMMKVGGFMSHTAKNGYYRCNKSFQTVSLGEKPDYSGIDRENWIAKTHYTTAMKHKQAKTMKDRHEMKE